MQNKEEWKESKYIYNNNHFEVGKEVADSSWLVTQLVADKYYESIPQYVRGNLLDLGCGMVPLFGLYSNYITDNVCVDWENSLHVNQFLDVAMDISNPLPFEENEFDTVICSDVLEHIYLPDKVLEEIIRVTKPGGYILLSTPFAYWMHELPFDYSRVTSYFYKRFVEEHENVEVISIQSLGGRKAVFIDKYAKLTAGHKWLLGKAIQKIYYKYWLANDNADTDTLEFFVVLRKR